MQLPAFPVARPSSATLPPGIFALPFGVLVLIAGLWGGLARLGYAMPNSGSTFAQHGFLMSIGFLGTLIATERAVALGKWWAWAVPALSILGSAWVVFTDSPQIGYFFFFLAGVDLVIVYIRLHFIQASTHNTFMGLAAVGWAVAAGIGMVGRPVSDTVPWLAIFLVVTITAERLELSRMLRRTRPVRVALVVILIITFVGATAAFADADLGVRLTGLGMAAMAVWLMLYDLARRTIKSSGVTRFMAAGLLTGYVWLAAGGALWALAGDQTANPAYDGADFNPLYDAELHMVFLGFVMSMVFAHAPVIAPAVIRKPLPYFPVFYGHLALLHASLILRVVLGDALGVFWAWRIGGVLNEISLVVFVLVNIGAFARAAVVQRRQLAERLAARSAAISAQTGIGMSSTPPADPQGSADRPSGAGGSAPIGEAPRPAPPPVEPPAGESAAPSASSTPPGHGMLSTIVGSLIGVAILVAAVIYANSGPADTADGTTDTSAAEVIPPEVAAAGIDVSLVEMKIIPAEIVVQPGTHVVLNVTNDGTMRHDVLLDAAGQPMTPVLEPGESYVLDVGTISADTAGWCTLPGHRSAGMTMSIKVASDGDQPGADAPDHLGGHMGGTGMVNPNAAVSADLSAEPPAGWTAIDAALPPADGQTVHEVTWHMSEVQTAVAPDVTQLLWTFDGRVPGPVLRGKVGDRFDVTVVNDTNMAHNIDFHAEQGPPAKVMTPVDPGATHTYSFEATYAGAWLYHCSVEPMLMHMGNGMYGALIIDPPDLEPADSEYVLVSSEFFFGEEGDVGDAEKMAANSPDTVVFNGFPFAYQHQPLTARVGELVRVWVVNAGPTRSTAFHVIGAPFTTQYLNGAYLLKDGMSAGVASGAAQTLPVDPGNGGFVELRFVDSGTYPFVSHAMADAVIGASGDFLVTD